MTTATTENRMTVEQLAKFKETRTKMNAAEEFIIEEGRKLGIKLNQNQAATFANIVLKVYGIK